MSLLKKAIYTKKFYLAFGKPIKSNRNKMILVTGGSGLVGSHLLFELARRGNKIRALKRESTNLFWVREIFSFYDPINSVKFFDMIEWVDGGLDDFDLLMKYLDRVDSVYHCAAMVSFDPSHKEKMLSVNIDGTANLVNACLETGVRRFCHCSSVAALGKVTDDKVIDEKMVWQTSKSNSNYAISKFGAEREVWRGAEEGLDVVIVNPTIILGPGDTSRSSSKIFDTIARGLKFYTMGKTGFVDVRDVARAMVQLAESDIKGLRFVLNSQNLTYKDFFEVLARQARVKAPYIKAGAWLLGLAWRLQWVKSKVTRRPPLVTKETAASALRYSLYSSKKIVESLDFKFYSIDDAVRNLASFHGNKNKVIP